MNAAVATQDTSRIVPAPKQDPWYFSITAQPERPSSTPRKSKREPYSGPVAVASRRVGWREEKGKRVEVREAVAVI